MENDSEKDKLIKEIKALLVYGINTHLNLSDLTVNQLKKLIKDLENEHKLLKLKKEDIYDQLELIIKLLKDYKGNGGHNPGIP